MNIANDINVGHAVGGVKGLHSSTSRPVVHPRRVEVHQYRPELLIVEDALEDGLVVVHAPHDGAHEQLIEDQPEVLD